MLVLLKIEPLDGFLHVDDNFVACFSSNPRRIFRRNLLIARIILRGNAPNQLTNERDQGTNHNEDVNGKISKTKTLNVQQTIFVRFLYRLCTINVVKLD